MNVLAQLFNAVLTFIRWLATPLVIVCMALFTPLAIILGSIADPQGAVNSFVCRIIDLIDVVLPRTPQSLTIGSLLSGIGNAFPFVGYGIVLELFRTATVMLLIVVAIKVYKLIPFKAS